MAIADHKKECSGTTAAVVVVKDNQLIVGNVGDTEVVVAVGSSPIFQI
jgi:serine/threonine protein phosphatase PrpC